VAPNPDRELAEARAAIDRDDPRAALKRLDRARRGYLKRHDTDGLEHLLLLADVLEPAEEHARIGRTNFVYAVQQNLRLESRRHARQTGQPWNDPYPDLQAPTEHTGIALTRLVKVAIGIGTALAAIGLVAFIVLPFLISSDSTSVRVRLLNDTRADVSVNGCIDPSCDSSASWMHADLGPGLSTERNVDADDLIDAFRYKRSGAHVCLPLRIHDAYIRHGSDSAIVLVGRLSQATACPGRTVLPTAGTTGGL
jgi:hypothetical protein